MASKERVASKEKRRSQSKEVVQTVFDQPRPPAFVQPAHKEGVILSPTSGSALMQRRRSHSKTTNGPSSPQASSPQPSFGPWRASHILFKHSGSRNPVSRRTGEEVVRSKQEAAILLGRLLPSLTCENFAGKALEHSDCSSFAEGGDLDWFGPNEMQEPFEEAVRFLAVGEISGEAVDTESGLHVMLRTG